MSYLELSGVHKSFGDLEVLSDINLSIEKNQFVVFVGPSGCGKSTLLRSIAGLEGLTKGSIHLDGVDISNRASSKRDMAMVFQSYALYPHMSVRKNISFALRQAKMPADQIKEKVDSVAEILALSNYLDRKPGQLSGGQRQRVAIGRAIVRNPKAFLFDEPLSNLDAALRVDMRMEIARLHRELDATTIYVTHDQVEAMTLADVVVVLKDGVVEQTGNPVELYDRPANLFVAQFIGMPRMSLVGAEASSIDDSSVKLKLADDCHLELPVEQNAANSANGAIKVGLRPEYVSVTNPSDGHINGTIDIVEHLGSDTFVYVSSGLDSRVTVRLDGHNRLQAGENIGLKFSTDHMHVFNRDGNNISVQQGAS